jgi:hypothetical protein
MKSRYRREVRLGLVVGPSNFDRVQNPCANSAINNYLEAQANAKFCTAKGSCHTGSCGAATGMHREMRYHAKRQAPQRTGPET